jgi:hypothetical protein
VKFIHRVVGRISPEQALELAAVGVDLSAEIRRFYEKAFKVLGGVPHVAFEIDEADPRWPAVAPLVGNLEVADTVRTEFTNRERDAAAWLSVEPDWHHGYPQPEDDFAYLGVTYDLGDYCDRCGTGVRQVAPFRMAGEPKWGRRGILQLNWVFDEYFVPPEVYAAVFEPLGIGSWPVQNRRGHLLGTVVQLRVDGVVEVDTTGLVATICPKCARPKFDAVRRGPYPGLRGTASGPLVRSDAWFGSGHSGWQLIAASAAVYRAARDAGLRGTTFDPLGASEVAGSGGVTDQVTLRDAD